MAEPAGRGGAGITESDAVAVENAGGGGRFVILCDHASNRFPPEFGSLGLSAVDRAAHIAWDPGALGVARVLARQLDAPLVRATISRLVIDCNRPLDAPDLAAETSETTAIPGNAHLSETERHRRIAMVHEPYHRVIDQLVGARLAADRETALLAIHSFTPVYRGVARPWQVGVIFDRDRTLADPLIAALEAENLKVGVNEPYSPADRVYYTLTRHAESRGLSSAMIEIRNDLIRSAGEQAAWAKRIGAHLASTVVVQQQGAVSVTCQTL
jgi:predicted N-formylglutamate amidohydrolase